MNVLKVEELSISFTRYTRGLYQQHLTVINDINLSIQAGEIVAVVGSSGSGKSLLAHAILGLLPGNAQLSGKLWYKGELLDNVKQTSLRGKEIALVPQSINYLDPLMRVGDQVRISGGGADSVQEQRNVFRRFRLAERVERLFPFQLSGGMARRVLVSTAAVIRPQLVVADEPTPGMHPKDVKEALKHFKEMASAGSAVLLITHDIPSALSIADKVAVLYSGTTIETALARDFTGKGEMLRHPYSKALWNALPQNEFTAQPGTHPAPGEAQDGCPFASRCGEATNQCYTSMPPLRELRDGNARCFHAS